MQNVKQPKWFDIYSLLTIIKSTFLNKVPDRLIYFYDIVHQHTLVESEYIQKADIQIAKIVGSMNLGRCFDFDANFHLRKSYSLSRLHRVNHAWETKRLPPINLVELDGNYFVQDGHHRIAIALEHGQTTIEAHVLSVSLQHELAELYY